MINDIKTGSTVDRTVLGIKKDLDIKRSISVVINNPLEDHNFQDEDEEWKRWDVQ